MTLGVYVFFRKDAAQYIGHYFNKQSYDSDNNMVWTTVQLTNITITTNSMESGYLRTFVLLRQRNVIYARSNGRVYQYLRNGYGANEIR